jgi:hypothetical protein
MAQRLFRSRPTISLRRPNVPSAQRLTALRRGVENLRAALLLGPVGFRRSALSQPAPGGRLLKPPSGAPELPVRACEREPDAASCSTQTTPRESALVSRTQPT